jgi:hypothetical protein
MHDLSFIGWGVVIPESSILARPHFDVYDIAEEYDMEVDWIAQPHGDNCNKEGIYIITLKTTRQEIYDQTFINLDEPYVEYGSDAFKVTKFLDQMEIKDPVTAPGWILAHYRM